MTNNELKSVIDYMEREKGLDKETLLSTVVSSLQSAARKSVDTDIIDPIIEIDPDSFDVSIHQNIMVIADDAKITSKYEINLSQAIEIFPSAKIGEYVQREITPKNFGRIAAQTAKQVIIQKLKEAQSAVVYNEYKDKIYQVVSGIVRHSEERHVVIDLGRGEAILKSREQIETEDYRVGDRLKVIVLEVKKKFASPEIYVSRSHPIFVKKLFELEVPEIADGTVEIKGVAREAGFRSKIAVVSNEPKIDCVGACVGMRGIRVKNIVQELSGEKIDIVSWHEDPAVFCRNAMNPAKLKKVTIDEETKSMHVTVDQSQFSLAIGKKGHNARLTSKLLGWKIDIKVDEKGDVESSDNSSPKKEKRNKPDPAQATINENLLISVEEIQGLNKKVIKYLLDSGYSTLADLKDLHIDEIYTIPGIGKSSAGEIMDIIKSAINGNLKQD